MNGTIYRCNLKCPIGKHCFIIKTEMPLKEKLIILQKCPVLHDDIKLVIGESRPP